MRVIAGSARRIRLDTPAGLNTRPTADRVKETLFNIISGDMQGAAFLDLFSGSGGIGIEALSRGAVFAVFADESPAAVRCIRANLAAAGFTGRARVYRSDALKALRLMEGRFTFDYIFMDPPYDRQLEKRALEYLASSSVPAKDATFIVEGSLNTDFSYAPGLGYTVTREKKYKNNKHVFLKKSA